MNRLERSAESELPQVILDQHVAAVEDPGSFIKPAVAALLLGEHNTCRRTTDLGSRHRVAGRLILVLVGFSVLVTARNAKQQVARRAKVQSTEDAVFQRVRHITVRAVKPFAFPPKLYGTAFGEKVIAAQFECLSVETGIAAADALGNARRRLAGSRGVRANHVALDRCQRKGAGIVVVVVMAILRFQLDILRQFADRSPIHGEGLLLAVQTRGRQRGQADDCIVGSVGQKSVILPKPAIGCGSHDAQMPAGIERAGKIQIIRMIVRVESHFTMRRYR